MRIRAIRAPGGEQRKIRIVLDRGDDVLIDEEMGDIHICGINLYKQMRRHEVGRTRRCLTRIQGPPYERTQPLVTAGWKELGRPWSLGFGMKESEGI